VRDNIHARDVASFIHAFCETPRCGEVYNLGGGKDNSCSILEAFSLAEEFSGKSQVWRYEQQNRIGDHICYYSDLGRLKGHYPDWSIEISLRRIVSGIVDSFRHSKCHQGVSQ